MKYNGKNMLSFFMKGESAFEIYKKYHPEYTGTEEEWIESLKGTGGTGGAGVEIVQTTGNSETAVMSQKAVTEKIEGIVQGRVTTNRFNISKLTDGIYLGKDGAEITTTAALSVTDYIPCLGGDIIRFTPLGSYETGTMSGYLGAFYDSNKSVISPILTREVPSEYQVLDGVEVEVKSTVAPSEAAYFRLNVHDNNISSLMITVNNNIPTVYEAYSEDSGTKLNSEIKVNSAIAPFPVGFNMIAYSQIWAFAPINTVPNYETAGFLGFDMIKGDVRITSDNVLVMCHDAGFTFNDSGRIINYSSSNSTAIRDMTAEQVLALEHDAYRGQFKTPVHPCTIDDYLRVCSKWKKIPFITVRDEYMEDIAPILVEKLKYWHFEDTAIINSFTKESLLAVRKLLPRIWLHNVCDFQKQIKQDTVDFCIRNYPCAIGVFNFGTDTDPDSLTDAMKNEAIVAQCKANRIPVLGAVAYTKKQIEYMRSIGYSGTQAQWIAPEFVGRRYLIHIIRTNGAWEFKRSQAWEYDGSITEESKNVYVKCNDIVPTWVYYLSPSVTAKCTTDASVTVTAEAMTWSAYLGSIKLTPSSIADGMEFDIRIEF